MEKYLENKIVVLSEFRKSIFTGLIVLTGGLIGLLFSLFSDTNIFLIILKILIFTMGFLVDIGLFYMLSYFTKSIYKTLHSMRKGELENAFIR